MTDQLTGYEASSVAEDATLDIIGDGLVRSRDLPTTDPGEVGDLWVDVAAGRVVKSSAG